jgi:hypothetical protein
MGSSSGLTRGSRGNDGRVKLNRRRRPPLQPSPADTGEGDPRSGWEGTGTSAAELPDPVPISRRAVLAAGVAFVAAPFGKPVHAAEPTVKITQAEAQYQPMPKGMFSCGVCTFFIRPTACKVVTGAISPNGWCKLFDLPD